MKNFIEIMGSEGKTVLINVNQIVAINNNGNSLIIHMVSGYEFPSWCSYTQLKHLIEESYL